MAAKAKPGTDIYQLRAVLRGISPLIWRRLLVRADSSVASLHEVLQVAFGWDDMHLNRFEIRGIEYGVYRDGGQSFSTDACKVRLCDLHLRRLERFVYEYDFGDLWIHDIRLEATLAADLKTTYPVCVAGKCAAPPEDCGGPHAFMANRWRYCAKGSGESGEEIDEWDDDLDEEESDTDGSYHPDRFDRRQVNRALALLASGSYEGALDEIHDSATD
ncbi:MAG: plasmid pRiA4b ORF-3 family protein [Gemmatimonadales bacterium]